MTLRSFPVSSRLAVGWVAQPALTRLVTNPFQPWSHLLRLEVQVQTAHRSDLPEETHRVWEAKPPEDEEAPS